MNQITGRIASVLLVTALCAGLLAGCGSRSRGESDVVVIDNPKYQEGSDVPADLVAPGDQQPGETLPQAPAQQTEEPQKPEAPEEEPSPYPHKAQSEETKALVARAAQMQDYSHAEGEDAQAVSVVDDNLLFLVNKTHPITVDYKASDMVTISKITEGIGTEETHQMRSIAADALYELFDGAKADGYDIRLRTGFRSYSYQNTLFNNYVKNNGAEAAARFSAKPGESEHQTGLCCDVGVNGVSLTGFNDRPEAAWVAQHAHEYGFILRYPEGKEGVTGYMYESWHIRYVGKEAAREIYEQGLTLEEYLGVTD